MDSCCILLSFLTPSRGTCVYPGPLNCRLGPGAWVSTWLLHSQKWCCHFPLAQDSGFPLKQLSRLLLVRPVRSQEHVGTASSYAGIRGDGMPRTSPCPLGLSSDPPFLSQPHGAALLRFERRLHLSLSPWGSPDVSWPETVLDSVLCCCSYTHPAPWTLASPTPGFERAESATFLPLVTSLLPYSALSFVFFFN